MSFDTKYKSPDDRAYAHRHVQEQGFLHDARLMKRDGLTAQPSRYTPIYTKENPMTVHAPISQAHPAPSKKQ